MNKAQDLLLAMEQADRVRALSYLPTEDLLAAVQERVSYHEWLLDSIKTTLSIPLYEDDKSRGVNLQNLTEINLGGNENDNKEKDQL